MPRPTYFLAMDTTKSQVGLDKATLSDSTVGAAHFDSTSKFDFLVGGKQRDTTNLAQIHTHWII